MPRTAKVEDASLTVLPTISAALAVAEGADRADRRGKEDMTQDDLILPRLALAQRTSPQIDPDKDAYIDNLKLYEMFNTVTGQNYGRGPVNVVIIRHSKRAIEFSADNRIVDMRVPLGDPRLNFGKDGSKPRATLFHEYLVATVPDLELMVLSLKGSQVPVARQLNSFLTVRPGATWKGQFAVTSGSKEKNGFTVANFNIRPNGATPPDVEAFAEDVFNNTHGRAVVTEVEVKSEDDPDHIAF